jgi:hypothetical protein
MITDAWIERFSALNVELRAPDDHGHFQCYYDGKPVIVCDPFDDEAIGEVVRTGVPLSVVVGVAQWYHENEGF